MDFNDIEIGENLSEVNNQADRDAWQADQIARLNKESMRMFGCKPISTVQLPRVAANPVSQQEYNTRLFSLLNMIKDTSLSMSRYPLADTWKALYPHIPYNDKATNWKISKKDMETIVNKMKDEGIYKRLRRTDGVAGVVAVIKDAHKTKVIEDQARLIAEQDERIQNYQFLMDGTEDRIIYKGHIMPYSTKHRGYHITLGGKKLVVSQKNIEKLQSVFDFIDMFEE